MTRGLRNNNPGNIRRNDKDNPFKGEVRPSQDASFRQFTTMAYGYRAMLRLLVKVYAPRGLNTISKILQTWAPPVENQTLAYIHAVAAATGIDQDAVIDFDDKDTMCSIAAAMSKVENGKDAVMEDVEAGWELL